MSGDTAPLVQALQAWTTTPPHLFCTPGHRRGQAIPQIMQPLLGRTPYQADLPDVPGLNLFAETGAIAAAQTLAAELFGADRTWFLVNGSTVGVTAAILATCGPGDKLILPRNCHQSAIAGLILSGAQPVFVMPDYSPTWDLAHCLTPNGIEQALAQHPETKAILLISPTYHGSCGNLAAIAAIAHRHHLPLIVDEAHGAHLAFHPDLPAAALASGADLVVQSTHKTLSALTQAAMLHLQGSRVSGDRITQALQLLQSSSPSNLLLASLDGARHQLATRGPALLDPTLHLSQQVRQALKPIRPLPLLQPHHAVSPGFTALDPTRITVQVTALGITGFTADDWLSEHHGILAELPTLRQLTFMISLGSTPADILALTAGLAALAATFANPSPQADPQSAAPAPTLYPPDTFSSPVQSPRAAFFAPTLTLPIAATLGQLSAETLCPYPPGIPILFPGEPITPEAIAFLQTIQAAGGFIAGSSDPTLTQLRVLREPPSHPP